MAQPTNLFDRYDATLSVREDLANIIYNISPEDTVFMSNVGRDTSKQTFTEWQTDALAAASTTNAQIEGDDAAADSLAATNRVGNYTQISRKVVATSGTLESVDTAGYRSAMAYQLAKAASELKRDMETAMLFNQAAVVGNATTARKTAGLPAWLRSNVSAGSGGGNPTMSSTNDGYPNAARTDGTQRTFTETMLKDVIQSVWTNGGTPKLLMVGPFNKRIVSSFSGIAGIRFNVDGPKPSAIIGAADIYVSDFGNVSIVPSRFQRERDAFVVDPEYAAVSYLRNFQTEELAKTGDSQKKMILVEYALKVRTEKAHGIIADLTTS
jgi:hypothetical protein